MSAAAFDIKKISQDLNGTCYTIGEYLQKSNIAATLKEEILTALYNQQEIQCCDNCGCWDDWGAFNSLTLCEGCADNSGDE